MSIASSSILDQVLSTVPMNGIDFGYCGVSQETTNTFTLNNSSSSQVRYSIQPSEQNFSVSSQSGKLTLIQLILPFSPPFSFKQSLSNVHFVMVGILAPKQKKEITVSFYSDEAKVIIASIVIKLNEGANELTRVLKVSAIGKYPFITLDQ